MDYASIWNALPMPCLILDEADRVAGANSAAEHFLAMSERSLMGRKLDQMTGISSPVVEALEQAHRSNGPVTRHDVHLGWSGRTLHLTSLQIVQISDQANMRLLILNPQSLAEHLDSSMIARGGR